MKEGIAKVAQQPFPALNAAQNQYLDAVLNVWEQRTAEVEQYQCQFKRWQFDPGVHATAAASIAEGELRFMDPDKGFFKVTTTKDVVGRAPEPEYKVNPKRPHGEHWICDGEWVHILDANAQKAVRIQLPPQMRGKQIHLSPLPFLFGVKAEEIKQRYWIRPIASPPGDDSVWLEAWPKRGDDAGAYSRVQVILSRKDSLPRGLIVYMPNWRPEQPHREVYEFTDRKTGASILQVLKQNVFMQAFIPTELPADWQVIEKPYVPPQQQQNVANPNAPNGAAPQVR